MAAPTKYSDAQYAFEYTLPTANAQETDTLVVLVVSGALLSTAQWDTLTATNFVFTDVSGNLIPSYLVSFDGTGDTMQCWVRWPNVSTVAAQAVYMQWGGTISRTNDSAAFTGKGFDRWYNLEDTASPAIDATGNADAAESGTPIWNQTGKVGGGVQFVKSSAEYLTADSPGGSAFTVSGWVKLDSFAASSIHGLVEFRATNGYRCGIQVRNDSFKNWLIIWDNGTNASFKANAGSAPTVDQWHHFAATFDGTTPRVIIDGVDGSLGSTTSGNFPAVTEMRLGAVAAAGSFHLDGTLDTVRHNPAAMSVNYLLREYNNENGFATDAIFAAGDYTEFASGGRLIGPSSLFRSALIGRSFLIG